MPKVLFGDSRRMHMTFSGLCTAVLTVSVDGWRVANGGRASGRELLFHVRSELEDHTESRRESPSVYQDSPAARPSRIATRIRPRTPTFANTRSVWWRTVWTLSPRSAAISLVEHPSAISPATWLSRRLRPYWLPLSRCCFEGGVA